MNTQRYLKWIYARPIVVAAVAVLALAGCKKKEAEVEKPTAVVQAAHPEFGSITQDIEGDAVLAPVAQAAIQAKVTAPVKTFYVQRGSRVKAGQVVARLESSDLAAAALDNKGTYEAAQGTYATATKSAVPQEATQARLDVAQAKAALELNQSIVNARTQLLAQGAIPGRDVDTARAALLQAQAAYDIATQKYQALQGTGQKASLETAQGQLTSAKGKYLGAEAQLNYTSIRTPIKGVVTERPLFAGETAAAGAPILTVMDTSAMIAKMHVAQDEAQQLVLGAPATLEIPGMDGKVQAKVSLVSPALDTGSTTVEVWLRAENPKGELKAGTAVHATIKGHTVPHALLISSDAVQRSSEGAGKTVLVIAGDGTAHKKTVTVGIQTTEMTQILDGLTPTDTVITTGGYGLDDGSKVKVEAAGAKPEGGAADEKLDSKKPGEKD